MGSGRNGTFDKTPDLQQWAVLTVYAGLDIPALTGEKHLQQQLYGRFITKWLSFFCCETFTLLLHPIEGHGTWDGKKAFGDLPAKSTHEGRLAVLTRANIRLNKIKFFWQHVAPVADKMLTAKGFVVSFGIGEVPWKKQATFSVWESKEDMKAFAYATKEHADVIRRTRSQKWYSEDMFTRFTILYHSGTIRGNDPLGGKS